MMAGSFSHCNRSCFCKICLSVVRLAIQQVQHGGKFRKTAREAQVDSKSASAHKGRVLQQIMKTSTATGCRVREQSVGLGLRECVLELHGWPTTHSSVSPAVCFKRFSTVYCHTTHMSASSSSVVEHSQLLQQASSYYNRQAWHMENGGNEEKKKKPTGGRFFFLKKKKPGACRG